MTRTCIVDATTGVVENIVEMGVAKQCLMEQRLSYVKGKPTVTQVPRFEEKAPEGKLLVPSDVAQVGDTYKDGKWTLIPLPKVPEWKPEESK